MDDQRIRGSVWNPAAGTVAALPAFRFPVRPACPRCKGRLYQEWDQDTGREWSCLNCGWRKSRRPGRLADQPLNRRRQRPNGNGGRWLPPPFPPPTAL